MPHYKLVFHKSQCRVTKVRGQPYDHHYTTVLVAFEFGRSGRAYSTKSSIKTGHAPGNKDQKTSVKDYEKQ